MNKHGLISIVIITKDTKELLRGLLNSIKNDLSLQPYIGKTIVVDNASADGTEEMIREEFPPVVCVRNERNMGFAFSANKGASLAENEYILFLNSDTILIQGELQEMIRFMDGNADVAICGPQLVYSDMKPQRSFAAGPSLWGEIFPQRGVRGQGREAANRKSEIVNGIGKETDVSESDSGSTIHDQDSPSYSPYSPASGSLSSNTISDFRFPISDCCRFPATIRSGFRLWVMISSARDMISRKSFSFCEKNTPSPSDAAKASS
jgi:glycosyltransferase involved in cell wall biosynthesis